MCSSNKDFPGGSNGKGSTLGPEPAPSGGRRRLFFEAGTAQPAFAAYVDACCATLIIASVVGPIYATTGSVTALQSQRASRLPRHRSALRSSLSRTLRYEREISSASSFLLLTVLRVQRDDSSRGLLRCRWKRPAQTAHRRWPSAGPPTLHIWLKATARQHRRAAATGPG